MKRFSAALLVVALVLGIAAAQAPTTLVVAAFPDLDSVLKVVIPDFERQNPGIKIELRVQQFGDHHNTLVTSLATGAGVPDATVIEIGFLGRFAREGGLTDLSKAPYNAGGLKDFFVEYAWRQGQTTDGRQIAIPLDLGPGTIYYRRDIFAERGVSIDQLGTWDGFLAAGRRLTYSSTGAVRPDRFFVPMANDVAVAMIRADLKPGEGIFFDARGELLVTTERFVDALTMAQQIRRDGLDARIGSWSNEWYEAFKRGTVAVQISGAWLGGHLANWMAPETAGKWGVAHLPEGSFISWGGSFYSIPERARNKDAAWQFVRYMTTNPAVQIRAFQITNAFPANKQTYGSPIFGEPIPFLAGQQARTLWVEAAQKITGAIINPNDVIAEEIVNDAIARVVDENVDVRQALADAKALIERRIRR
jgi:multiple sugar transport system substrate-binding protein